jgi:hypothetical protein
MPLSFDFVVEHMARDKIYPHLARWQAEPYTMEWRQFGNHWPFVTPLRIQEYCVTHGVLINVFDINQPYPAGAWYPVAIGFFDFGVDYFGLIPEPAASAIRAGRLKVLFFYHEGDNPARIKTRLDNLVKANRYPIDCYVFVSSNSAASKISGFVAFQDSELWYYQRNIHNLPLPVHSGPRQRDFTVLCRQHRWWRATAMADLWRQDLLSNSYWSYCESATGDDDCPIEVDSIAQLRHNRSKFLAQAPYFCDSMTQDQRNDHSLNVEPKFFEDAYCNIVLESQFDYDQSGGCLISEKTFKPIKHGQMFFVAGGCGSLAALRDMGYRTFDGVLDNSYDREPNHTQRWIRLSEAIAQAHQQGLHRLFEQCRSDIEHNQQLFMQIKTARLNTLIEQINEQHR